MYPSCVCVLGGGGGSVCDFYNCHAYKCSFSRRDSMTYDIDMPSVPTLINYIHLRLYTIIIFICLGIFHHICKIATST